MSQQYVSTTANCLGGFDLYGYQRAQERPWDIADVLAKFTTQQLLELKRRLPPELQKRAGDLEKQIADAAAALGEIRAGK